MIQEPTIATFERDEIVLETIFTASQYTSDADAKNDFAAVNSRDTLAGMIRLLKA